MVRRCNIFIGSHVEGSYGPLIANPNPATKRRVRSRTVGTVVRAAGHHKWDVLFDYDGKTKSVASNSLTIVPPGTGIPLDELSEAIAPPPYWHPELILLLSQMLHPSQI